VETRYFGKAIG